MAKGVNDQSIFKDDEDRAVFIRVMKSSAANIGAKIYAYCLMGNHFHLAVRVAQQPLGLLMQRILTSYAASFNKKHDRHGHLFQARYKSILCLDDAYLITLIKYIHLNPVRAGLTDSPESWPWSSCRDFAASRDDTDSSLSGALERILSDEAIPPSFSPWAEQARSEAKPPARRSDHSRPLHEHAKDAERQLSLRDGTLTSSSMAREIVRARRLFALNALKDGFETGEIARFLGYSPSAISRYTRSKSVNSARTDTIKGVL